jgi:hypothetical protein
MIYMKIFKKGGVVEKRGGGGNEIHAPCACGLQIYHSFFQVYINVKIVEFFL